ncbi:ABC transporter ATP-binding protein [Bacillus piscicola]|uniref:ABC transporter ATP-binding protein n=1 Tax=Bacillus piscicola TaxID=1632684 RepID=UPI001F091430|nr:ABC transporter ATP-binding protein [Bacillus piscicola]
MLQVKNVTKTFGGVVANKEVNFSVGKGEIVGLIGPNGAGKSTMFNMISAIFPPTKGEIIFRDLNIEKKSTNEMAPLGISRTFQNLQIFKRMTVVENVMIGRHIRTKTGMLKAALKLPSAKDEERKAYESALECIHFVGLEKVLDQQAGNLALGDLRLLELARALAVNPELLLLDEIAAGLNQKESKDMSKLIQKIREQGITVFVVEHDMDLVMSICDKVIVLDQGEKIAEGTPQEIQGNQQVITAYLGAEEMEEVKQGGGA